MISDKYYKINILSTADWMYAFTIRIYQSYTYYDIVISGYNYGPEHWYSPAATLIGSTGDSIQVHFGYDSDNNLWVAIPAGNYTGLTILDSANGYRAVDPKFSITLIDSLPNTVQKTITAYRPANINELNRYALASTVNTLSTKISKMEANIDMATLVASGTFSGSVKYGANSRRSWDNVNFYCTHSSASTASLYVEDSETKTNTAGTISPVACSYIVFKFVRIENSSTSSDASVSSTLVEFKVKAGSIFTIPESSKDKNSATITLTLSSDGKTVTITSYNKTGNDEITYYTETGWYECYA